MAETARSTAAGPVEFAERWARACAELAVYPATNLRVREQLREVVELAGRALAGSGRLRIAFAGDTVRLEQHAAAFEPGSRLGWVRDRLRTIGAAGVALQRGLDTGELAAFASRLAAVRPDSGRISGARVDEARLEAFGSAHIDLLPWRFSAADVGEDGEWSELGDPHGGGARNAFVATILETVPEIRARLTELQALVGLHDVAALWSGGTAEHERFDVLGAIHAALPAEALQDPRACAAHVRTALERTIAALSADNASGAARSDIVRLALDAFRRVDGPAIEATPEEPPLGNPRSHPEPDVATLVAAWQALPETAGPPLDAEALDEVAEQTGALLHTLVRSDSVAVRSSVRATFARCARREPRRAFGAFQEWFQAATSSSDPRPLARLLTVVEELELRSPMLATVTTRAEHVLAAFPELLPRFLRDMPLLDLLAPRELPWLVEQVGAKRLRDLADTLPPFDGAVADKLVQRAAPCLVPLWYLLLRQRGAAAAPAVARAIGGLGEHFADADLVQLLLGSPSGVALDFLLAITELDGAGARSAATIRLGTDALVELLVTTRRDREQIGRRRAALLLASRYPGALLRQLVGDIAEDRGLLGVGGEEASIREAARRAIERMDNPGRSNDRV